MANLPIQKLGSMKMKDVDATQKSLASSVLSSKTDEAEISGTPRSFTFMAQSSMAQMPETDDVRRCPQRNYFS